MACVNDKNQLNATARKLLQGLEANEQTAQELVKIAGIPLFKVRSMLRELKGMGYVTETADNFSITSEGRAALK